MFKEALRSADWAIAAFPIGTVGLLLFSMIAFIHRFLSKEEYKLAEATTAPLLRERSPAKNAIAREVRKNAAKLDDFIHRMNVRSEAASPSEEDFKSDIAGSPAFKVRDSGVIVRGKTTLPPGDFPVPSPTGYSNEQEKCLLDKAVEPEYSTDSEPLVASPKKSTGKPRRRSKSFCAQPSADNHSKKIVNGKAHANDPHVSTEDLLAYKRKLVDSWVQSTIDMKCVAAEEMVISAENRNVDVHPTSSKASNKGQTSCARRSAKWKRLSRFSRKPKCEERNTRKAPPVAEWSVGRASSKKATEGGRKEAATPTRGRLETTLLRIEKLRQRRRSHALVATAGRAPASKITKRKPIQDDNELVRLFQKMSVSKQRELLSRVF